ncbi:annexin A5-like [Arapaima gigas]
MGQGTSENVLIEILASRIPAQVKEITSTYQQREFLKSTRSCQVMKLKTASRGRPLAVCKRCFWLGGFGRDEYTTTRIMVSRSEVDMLDIRAEFKKKFSISLHSMIQNETSGDYGKTLLLLCGGDDP